MKQDTTADGSGTEEGDPRGAYDTAEAVRTGDTVVYTDRRDTEYEFTVDAVDAEWISFENGQQVHRDRFDREQFAVAQTRADSQPVAVTGSDAEAADPTGTSDAEVADPPGTANDPAVTAADGSGLQRPNAN